MELPEGNSRAKIETLLARVGEIDTSGNEQLAQIVTLAISMNVPAMIAGQLPEDPRDLDAHLEQAARLFLQLRSDYATPLVLVPGVPRHDAEAMAGAATGALRDAAGVVSQEVHEPEAEPAFPEHPREQSTPSEP